MAFACVSCDMFGKGNNDGGNDDNNDNQGGGDTVSKTPEEAFSVFEAAIAKASAKTVVVTVKTATELGELNSEYSIFFGADGAATVSGSYERFYEIGEGPADEVKYSTSVNFYRTKEGTYSDNSVDVSAVEAAVALDISSLKSTANISADYEELTATVAKSATAGVFGTALTADASLKMVLDGDNLGEIVITYGNTNIVYNYAN